MKSFLNIQEDSDFPLENIPFGVFYKLLESKENAWCGTRIGDFVIDLAMLDNLKLLPKSPSK